MTIIELSLSGFAYGGEAFGRDHDGRMIFVPFALPDELVRVEIVEEHKRWARAQLLEVLEPSSSRTEPRCSHFHECGGCHYQHIPYDLQLEFKREILRDQFKRIGGFEDANIDPVIPSPDPWNYRNRIRFSLTEDGALGFVDHSGSQVIKISECHLPDSEILDAMATIDLPNTATMSAVEVRTGIEGERMLIFHGEGDPSIELEVEQPDSIVWLGNTGATVLAGENYILMKVHNRYFRVSSKAFFQVNTSQIDRLVDLVIQRLCPKPDEMIFDLYAGVGLFSAFIAERGARLIAVEESPSSCLDFEHNLNEFEDVVLYEAAVEGALRAIHESPDAVVLDPPRSGLSRDALDAVVKQMPERIIYVSCDPATLARDGKRLHRAKYNLDTVTPIDLFPQTYHIESVSRWSRI
jgi:23S rRNA (uracil1939-C5)-methyltransferase